MTQHNGAFSCHGAVLRWSAFCGLGPYDCPRWLDRICQL